MNEYTVFICTATRNFSASLQTVTVTAYFLHSVSFDCSTIDPKKAWTFLIGETR